MQKYFLHLLLLFYTNSFAQNTVLADSFFDDGEYQKALVEYELALAKQPHRADLFIKKIKCHQELSQYSIAEKALIKKLNSKTSQPQLYVELGYNYALQKDTINAKIAYNKAILTIDKNPHYARIIGPYFEKYNLLSEAEETYNKAKAINPLINVDFQLANVYGQQNRIEKMFSSYLSLIKKNKTIVATVQNLISRFLTDDAQNENNILLKRALLKKLQNSPNIFWNEQLSWLFVHQKEYDKAFRQEKAIFKREGQTLDRIFDLGLLAMNANDFETAQEIFEFIKTQALEKNTHIKVVTYLLNIQEKSSPKKNHNAIALEYQKTLDSFGINNNTISIQLAYANFLAFKQHKIQEAITFLKANENQSLSKFNKANYQMKLADILVADSKFNQALINYSKIQRRLKNNVLAQEAGFKIAKTSYYKGDFEWAIQQLNVLKTATSKLIANDALELHLLINDHILEDTLHVALKKYAKADLLAFQNKTEQATELLTDILDNHPVNKIVDDALFLQGKLYEQQQKYTHAIKNYQRIITYMEESIFVDDALFKLANIHLNILNNKVKASEYYETILFNHADSIHFIEAQKMYRKLRGDLLDNS